MMLTFRKWRFVLFYFAEEIQEVAFCDFARKFRRWRFVIFAEEFMQWRFLILEEEIQEGAFKYLLDIAFDFESTLS